MMSFNISYLHRPKPSWKWLKFIFMEYWKRKIGVRLNKDYQKQLRGSSKRIAKKRYINKNRLNKYEQRV